MKGSCLITTSRSITEILNETPVGLTAMFKVISTPSNVEDRFCGEMVYIKNDKVHDFYSNETINGLSAANLKFISYINHD